MTITKRVLLGSALALLLMQFIRPQPNVSIHPPGKDDFLVRFSPPLAIRTTLERACYDCHSDNTHYPWYAQVQPVGWWLASHVNDGKQELNFSVFGSYSVRRQAKKLDHIADEMTNRTMPLRSYTWIHRDARLTSEQVRAVTDWTDALRNQVAPDE